MTKIVQHEVNWTPDKIAGYWDYISQNPSLSDMYFTKHAGKAVVRDFLRSNNLAGKSILDFGCGPGNLFVALDELCKDFKYTGCDFSQSSIEQVNQKFEANSKFSQAFHITGFPLDHSKTYDFIICCEVIEHLDNATLANVSNHLYKLLNPGGVLYVTTPNNEDLEAAKTMCPECGCVFHRWQHMRSWSKSTISTHFEKLGFKTLEAKALNFDNNLVKEHLKTLVKSYVLKRAPRNLVYMGKKV